MKTASKILVIGYGDIGERLLHLVPRRYKVHALVRRPGRARSARRLGAKPILGDLAKRRSLRSLKGRADILFHFAPPPGAGRRDHHTRNLLAALGKARGAMLPQRIVYISTTGVYGDCHGGRVDESTPVRPTTARAVRRVDAERVLRKWGHAHKVAVSILRAPGIYAYDRLPLERIRRGVPALLPEEDVYTNHIHADDLANAAWRASQRPRGVACVNVVDDSELKMGEYFDLVADRFGLARSPRVSREALSSHVSPAMMSFMRESRRIDNARMKRQLRLELRYATVKAFLDTLKPD
jgi:nucleoside-diphosphate-sugar epimerase